MPPKGKAKAPSPAAAASPVQVEDLFSALHRHIQAFEYEQAAKVADQVLAVAPGDEDALRCKVVALIKADAIDRALLSIETATTKGFKVDLSFYKAYCLFRQNKLQEALEALEPMEKSAMVLQLESQILYRLGRMNACVESYDKLRKLKIDSLDLKTNIIAALIAAGRASEVEKTMDALKVKPSSSFEMAYNFACSLIEKKQYADAQQMLLSARRIGQETLMEDDFLDEDIESELAPVAVQLAYAQQLQGNTAEALEIYSDVVNKKIADPSSMAIATNNLIALKGGKEVSDGLRKLDQLVKKDDAGRRFLLADGLEFKLARQKEALLSNRVLLLLQANKLEQAQEMVSCLSSIYPGSITPALLQAAVLVRGKNVVKAEEVLAEFAERVPEKAPAALLARAQIAAAAGHAKVAAESLLRIPGIEHMPATVATVVALRERAGDVSGAAAVLDAAVAKGGGGGIALEAAAFKAAQGWEEEAAALYEELYAAGRGGEEALAALVKTAASVDPLKAEGYERKLRPLRGLKGVDVASLERDTPSAAEKKEAAGEERKRTAEERRKKKKRKRKPRYPKGFDAANPGPPPDPERWLPRRERSTYRPKRRDKRHLVRGAQGAVAPLLRDSAAAAAPAAATKAPSSEPARSSGKSRKKSRS